MKYVKYYLSILFLASATVDASSDFPTRKMVINNKVVRVTKIEGQKITFYDTLYEYDYTTIYRNIRGTVYHALEEQCDSTPFITADNSLIDTTKINKLRWVALSRNILNRRFKTRDGNQVIWKGKIKLGDTIWIEYDHKALKKLAGKDYAKLKLKYEKVRGWWIVKDVMGAYYWKPEPHSKLLELNDTERFSGEYKVKNGVLHKKFYQDSWIDFLQDHKDGSSMKDSWNDRVLIIQKREIKSIEVVKKIYELDANYFAVN